MLLLLNKSIYMNTDSHMCKVTFKQKVVDRIKSLPTDASLEEMILEIYILTTSEKGSIQREFYQSFNPEDILKRVSDRSIDLEDLLKGLRRY